MTIRLFHPGSKADWVMTPSTGSNWGGHPNRSTRTYAQLPTSPGKWGTGSSAAC